VAEEKDRKRKTVASKRDLEEKTTFDSLAGGFFLREGERGGFPLYVLRIRNKGTAKQVRGGGKNPRGERVLGGRRRKRRFAPYRLRGKKGCAYQEQGRDARDRSEGNGGRGKYPGDVQREGESMCYYLVHTFG